MAFAEVAVDTPAQPGKTFSYSIPPGLHIQVGHAIQVPFGPRQLPGFVFQITDLPGYPETRDVARVIDTEPWLSPAQIVLARWISQTYRAPLYSAAALMIPPGFRQRVVAVYSPVAEPPEEALARLDDDQREVLTYVQARSQPGQRDLEKQFGKRRAEAVLAQLARRRLVERRWVWQRPGVQPKYARVVRLAVSRDAARDEIERLARSRAAKQRALLQAVAEAEEPYLPVTDLTRQVGPAGPALAALAERGFVKIDQVRVERDPLAGRTFVRSDAPRLMPHQELAWRRIEEASDRHAAGAGPQVFLLFGVTGSGKTELYLRALEKAVAQGKRGIVLVPEIALTPQTIERFSARFPGRVAVLHSRLSPGEYFDEWWRIREGRFDVVVGPRSALFAPQPDLGLIILDEEHEWTYKQYEQQPYYHARDVAIKLAELTGATVILGSATPSIESYHRARSGASTLLELPERIIDLGQGVVAVHGRLPTVQVVDMREEMKARNWSIFSRPLRVAMLKALEAREQIILFLNRRGSATFVQCRDCGHVLRCRRCDTALTYHGDRVALKCHQCNWQTAPPKLCPQCWSPRIRYLGLGTQRLEAEVAQNFPRAGILRWDRDVTHGRDAHEAILRQFQERKADILIGTQMLAKGLHLPNVTLVGVINADIGLYVPDYHAPERVFQVLCQVAGRSGRGEAGGRVIIQTYSPENYAVAAAAIQDYESFYSQEIVRRRELGLPPFGRLVRLVYQHSSAASAGREADRVARVLRERLQTQGYPNTKIVGPAPAPHERLRGRYRWHLIVQGPDPNQLLDQLALPEGWTVDVDPVQLL